MIGYLQHVYLGVGDVGRTTEALGGIVGMRLTFRRTNEVANGLAKNNSVLVMALAKLSTRLSAKITTKKCERGKCNAAKQL